MISERNKSVKSFRDLEVYQNLYRACITVMKQIIPKLPSNEKYDLADQLARASKAAPRLVAEGYAKKHQKSGFQKYIDDAMAECNEIIVCIEQTPFRAKRGISGDCHGDKVASQRLRRLCNQLIDTYDKSARQLYRLAEAWDKFKNMRRKPLPLNDTGSKNKAL